MKVAVMRYASQLESLRQTLQSINGLNGIGPQTRVLLKPNILWGGGDLPRFGVATTARLVEDMILLLKEKGCRDISIGEGSIYNSEMKSDTQNGFRWAGIDQVAEQYKIPLFDLNEGPFTSLKFEDVTIRIASRVRETDFLINLPVLKTHGQAKVSLGMKNLKGCIDYESKKRFHRYGLNKFIGWLASVLHPALTVIDGIYALERGPSPYGTAYRTNLLIASRDPYGCDAVGASILGLDPAEVEHLQEYAQFTSTDINAVEVVGENIETVRKPLAWSHQRYEIFNKADIKGIEMRDPGLTFCSGCSSNLFPALSDFCRINRKKTFSGFEIILGRESKPFPGSQKVILMGNCPITINKNCKDAIRVPGCPPTTEKAFEALVVHTLGEQHLTEQKGMAATLRKAGKKVYDPKEFEPAHFRM